MPTEEEDVLKGAGFVSDRGCFRLGNYYVYLPRDTRSGKCELSHEIVGVSRTDFPPTTVKGVIRQMKLWDAHMRDKVRQ